MKTALWILLGAALSHAADINGDWIAEISAKNIEHQYARVKLNVAGNSVTGTWNQLTVAGTVNGDRLSLSLQRGAGSAGSFAATANGGEFSGEGRLTLGGRGGGGGAEAAVSLKLTRPPTPSAAPRTLDYDPPVFYGYYSAANPPALRIFPG